MCCDELHNTLVLANSSCWKVEYIADASELLWRITQHQVFFCEIVMLDSRIHRTCICIVWHMHCDELHNIRLFSAKSSSWTIELNRECVSDAWQGCCDELHNISFFCKLVMLNSGIYRQCLNVVRHRCCRIGCILRWWRNLVFVIHTSQILANNVTWKCWRTHHP